MAQCRTIVIHEDQVVRSILSKYTSPTFLTTESQLQIRRLRTRLRPLILPSSIRRITVRRIRRTSEARTARHARLQTESITRKRIPIDQRNIIKQGRAGDDILELRDGLRRRDRRVFGYLDGDAASAGGSAIGLAVEVTFVKCDGGAGGVADADEVDWERA